MEAFLLDSAALLLRWLHVVAAIAWIGESFYFVALDRGLRAPASDSPGLAGESWSVHGGGFYRKQKFMPAPPALPEVLHWSKWKSYTTWLSGFALLCVLYLGSPKIYLLDPAVADLGDGQAIALVLAFLAGGWIIYDALCRLVGFRDRLLGALMAAFVLALCWATTELFAGRAAFLLSGAVLATIMSANVFFVIIPGQKRMVEALRRGEPVDPLPGLRGKQRSVHNTYFTLPVVFAMLAIHAPAAQAHPWNWAILALFMAAGAAIREFFVRWHAGERAWWLPALGALLLLAAFAWMAPRAAPAPAATNAASGDAVDAPADQPPPPTLAEVMPVLKQHCAVCHGSQPTLMPAAPLGLLLDDPTQAERAAARIHQQAVVLRIMPPGNLTGMSEEERALIGRWAESAR